MGAFVHRIVSLENLSNKEIFPKFNNFTIKISPIILITLIVFSSILISNFAAAAVISIDVDKGPRSSSLNSNTNLLYVSNLFSDTVSVIDTTTDTVLHTIPVFSPSGIAANPSTDKIYVLSGSDVVVIDGTVDPSVEDPIITTLEDVGFSPSGIDVNPDTNKVYVSNRFTDRGPNVKDDVVIIDGSTDTISKTLTVGGTAVAVSVNPITNMIYVAQNSDLAVSVIDGSTDMVVDSINIDQVGTVGHGPFALILNSDEDILYVSNCHIGRFPGIISVVDIKEGSPNENSIIDNITVEAPGEGSFDADNNRLYVGTQEGNTVAVIDTTTNEVIAQLPGGDMAIGATLDDVNNKLYVMNFGTTLDFPFVAPNEDGTVTVLDLDNLIPNADAGPEQTVDQGSMVTLDGSASSDPQADPLTFSWEQTVGEVVALADANTANPTFTAPNAQSVLGFELTVGDGTFEVTDTVNIFVKKDTSFEIDLAASEGGVSGQVDVGKIDGGSQIILQYQTPQEELPNGELVQTLINSGIDGDNVGFSFDIRSQVPDGLPPLPASSALFFDIDVQGIDFSDPANFATGQLPITRFLVDKDFEADEQFDDECPVIFLYLLDEETGKWEQQGDPLKPNTNKIYVANFDSDTVSVIDGSSNNVFNIDVQEGPFEIAFNSETNLAYVTNQESGTVSVIDGGTNTVIDTFDVGNDPIAIAVNPTTNSIYVANQGSNDISVYDGTTNNKIGTITVDSIPVGFAINSITNKVYVANKGSDSISVIDGAANVVEDTIEVGDAPSAIGINPNTNKVYVANRGSDTISVIDADTNTVEEGIAVGNSPISLTVDPATNLVFVYVANLFSDSISVIDGTQGSPTFNQLLTNIDVGDGPSTVSINPNTKKLYVTNNQDDTVSVVDSLTNTVLSTINVGSSPVGLAVNSDVPNPVREPSFDVIDDATGEILQCAYLAKKPHLSKFSFGGAQAQPTGGIGGGVVSAGGGGSAASALSPPILDNISFSGVAQTNEEGIIEFGGVIFDELTSENNLPTQTIEIGENFQLRLPLYVENGINSLQHVAVYILEKSQSIQDSDAYVIYEKNDPLLIHDPHGLTSSVSLETIEKSSVSLDMLFDFTFEKSFGPSDVKVLVWDTERRSSDYKFTELIHVVDSISSDLMDGEDTNIQSSGATSNTILKNYENEKLAENSNLNSKNNAIPLWIKNNAHWWSNDKIDDMDFVSGIQYLIDNDVMIISKSASVSADYSSQVQIPTWIKVTAQWWAYDLISDEEVVQAFQWLIEKGVIEV